MKIKQARTLTGYEKVPWYEGYNLCPCDYCDREMTRYNSCNELKTSYEYEEYNQAYNKCVFQSILWMFSKAKVAVLPDSMAQARQDGVDLVVGLF